MSRQYKDLPSAVIGTVNRTVSGIAAAFGNVDHVGDLIMPGAFVDTLKARKPIFLWGHNDSEPPTAIIKSIQEVDKSGLPPALLARFPAVVGGLLIRREYLDTPRGNEALAAIQAGALTGMSIGYNAAKVDYKKINGQSVRLLLSIDLYEVSDVNFPANEATAAQKGRIPANIRALILRLEIAKHFAESFNQK